MKIIVMYTASDRSWAEWIQWTLEQTGGYDAQLSGPGNNRIFDVAGAVCSLMLLSPEMLLDIERGQEWTQFFAADPLGLRRLLLPVKVKPCHPQGLLGTISTIDLVGLSEDEAKRWLLAGLKQQRQKPRTPPPFPG